MSLPLKRTSPSTRAPGTVSCMRLRHRSSVDLPHPDGPMIAVTCPGSTANETSLTMRDAPKNASSATAAIAALFGSTSVGVCVTVLAAAAASVVASAGRRTSRSVAAESEAGSRREAGCETDDEDETEEDECSRPGLRVPVVVGRCGIVVDLHG